MPEVELQPSEQWAAKTALTVIRKFRSEGGEPDQYKIRVSQFLHITDQEADRLIVYLEQEGFLANSSKA